MVTDLFLLKKSAIPPPAAALRPSIPHASEAVRLLPSPHKKMARTERTHFLRCGHAGAVFTPELVSQISPYQSDLLRKAYSQLIQGGLLLPQLAK